MGRQPVASIRPGLTSSMYLVRSVFVGFAAISFLICVAAILSFQGIEHIHVEASHSLQSLPGSGLTHTNVYQLIAAQSRRLLGRVELLLGLCEISAVICGALTLWTVRSSLRHIQQQSDELNLLSWRMSQEHEVIARRFSHEIHDEFGQMLTGLRMMLQHATVAEFEKRRSECLDLIDDAISNVRELSQLLRPVILDDFGLNEALQWMISRIEDQTKIRITYTAELHRRLPEDLETQFFRIAQEGLANMIRHAKATDAEVSLSAVDGRVLLIIRDNGVGFPPHGTDASPRRGMGLVGMKARVRHMGGAMKIENQPGGGAALFFSVPLTPESSRPVMEPPDA